MSATKATPKSGSVKTPYSLSIRLEGLPKSPNALLGAHWSVRAGHAKKWKRAVWRQCWHLRPPKPLAKAHVTLLRASAGRMDADNARSSLKAIMDGLVEAGIIVDDNPDVVGEPTLVPVKCARGCGHVVVTVREINQTQGVTDDVR